MVRLFQILNMVALVVTVVVNYLSNTGIFNNETMATISAKFQNLFTPAGYAFSIWGLIYLGLFGFVIYYGPFSKNTDAKEKVILNVGWWFAISCVANSLWIFAWLYEYTFLSIPIMILLFISLLKIIGNNRKIIESKDLKTIIFLRLPFYIYSGWISVALIANVAAYLKKNTMVRFGNFRNCLDYCNVYCCCNHSFVYGLETKHDRFCFGGGLGVNCYCGSQSGY